MLMKKLNNGIQMPALGLGTYRLSEREECVNGIITAVKAGYRLIDTAKFYRNEEQVGTALREVFDRGLAKREEMFISTKVWYDSFERDDCIRSLEDSFEKLGLEQIDLVLLHWPFGNVYAAWRVLEEYYEAGRIRAIGVSNMEADRLIDLIKFNKTVPAVNQIEAHLYCQRQTDIKWLAKYGVIPQAYAPLGHGKADRMFSEPDVLSVAAAHGKTPAQVLLHFLIRSGITVIPKSSHEERIRENIDIFDFELSDNEMSTLRALDQAAPMIGRPDDPVKVEEMLY